MREVDRCRNVARRWIRIRTAAGLAVLLAACSSGPPLEDLENAESSLREIDDLLDQALVAYEGGDQEQALELAERAGLDLYEGETEGVVAEVAPSVNREFDSLIEATIPGAIEDGVPQEELVAHVERARPLIEEALQAIEERE